MGPAQSLVSASVGPAHKQPTAKKGQLVRGFRQQWSGGHEVESEVTGRAWPSPRGTPAHPAFGQLVSWGWGVGAQGSGWGLCHAELQSPH